MINLLPPEEKQVLLAESKKKLATIWGTVLLVSLICLTLILLSIKFYILAETDNQKNILKETEQKNKTSDFMNFNSIIKKYNGILAQLDSFYEKEVYFTQALKIITTTPVPNGLYFKKFSLNRDRNGTVNVNVSGFSITRDGLLIFKKNVEDNKEIKNPYFSPESWINQKNVNFSLTFIIDKIGE